MWPIFKYLVLGVGLLFFWQVFVTLFQLPDYILPSPIEVFITFYNELGLIAEHSIPTTIETILGFLLGILFGSIAALGIAFFRPLKFWFLPLLLISQAIPTFAVAPLIVIWLGYGLSSKIATTVLMIFFPITSALYDGLKCTNLGWLDLAKSMNASQWRTFCYISLPAALPAFASGVRIAAVIAPIGAIIGEWVGSSKGLGYLMLNANARLQLNEMFASLLVIVILALVLYFSVDRLLRFLISWQEN